MAYIQADADIMNMALRRIGAEAITLAAANTPTSKEAKVVTQFYAQVRDEILRSHPWPCITAKVEGSLDTDLAWATGAKLLGDFCYVGTSLYQCIQAGTSAATVFAESTSTDITDGTAHWKYLGPIENNTDFAYQYIIPYRTMRILEVGDGAQYQRIGRWIYTDEADAIITLTYDTEDPYEWDSYIRSAIYLRLASVICMAIRNETGLGQALAQEAMLALSQAQAIASGEASAEPEHDTQWVDV